MINPDNNNNGLAAGSNSAPSTLNNPPPTAHRKTALKDVQNENARTTPKQQDSVLPRKLNGDSIKVCGTKRLTPERPTLLHSLPSLAHNNGTNENVMNARRRFELELGRGRLHNNIERFSELKNVGFQPRQEAPQMRDVSNAGRTTVTVASNLTAVNGPLVPASSGKNVNGKWAAAAKGQPVAVEPKLMGEQVRTERFVQLQKFLKQCDETGLREYTQRLLHLSPSELSKHAVELEKRAIQLTIEEVHEMQRMRTLNILAKSSPTNSLPQSDQSLQSHKH